MDSQAAITAIGCNHIQSKVVKECQDKLYTFEYGN